jgi:signal peptidase I
MVRGQRRDDGIFELVRTLVYALVIALSIRTVLFEPFNIPSGSMIPTLLVGDYLFVSKFSYGYSKHSLPLSPDLFSGRILSRPVERGDVVVFKYPDDNKTDYIKRVVGLPGDRIQVTDGVLQINGQPVKLQRIEDYVSRGEGIEPRLVPQYLETLPGGRTHRIIEVNGNNGDLDNTEVFIVPADHYFMMGDNRDNSLDSRAWKNHFVPAENLVGKAQYLFFSLDGGSRIWQFWEWPTKARFERLFNAVE